uniref:Uncharacterized protein n=1 Tax=Strongyloides papillosus TaxID=174720 RepID=A0A0N5BU58_STREA
MEDKKKVVEILFIRNIRGITSNSWKRIKQFKIDKNCEKSKYIDEMLPKLLEKITNSKDSKLIAYTTGVTLKNMYCTKKESKIEKDITKLRKKTEKLGKHINHIKTMKTKLKKCNEAEKNKLNYELKKLADKIILPADNADLTINQLKGKISKLEKRIKIFQIRRENVTLSLRFRAQYCLKTLNI